MELWKWASSLQQAMMMMMMMMVVVVVVVMMIVARMLMMTLMIMQMMITLMNVGQKNPFFVDAKIRHHSYSYSYPRPVPTDGKAPMIDGGSWLRGFIFWMKTK